VSPAGEAQPSQDPKGTQPGDRGEADTRFPRTPLPAQGGRGVSPAGEAQPSQDPKGTQPGDRGEADTRFLAHCCQYMEAEASRRA
jgi:hypothetical protein